MHHITSKISTEFFLMFAFTINFMSIIFKTKLDIKKVYTIEL